MDEQTRDDLCPECGGTGSSKCKACDGYGTLFSYRKRMAELPTVVTAMEVIALRKEVEFWRRMYSEKGMR